MKRIIVARDEYPRIVEAIRSAVEAHPEFRGWTAQPDDERFQPDPWDADSLLLHRDPNVLWVCSAFFTGPARSRVDVVYFDKEKGVPFWGSPTHREWWDRDLWHVSIHSQAREIKTGRICAQCRRNKNK